MASHIPNNQHEDENLLTQAMNGLNVNDEEMAVELQTLFRKLGLYTEGQCNASKLRRINDMVSKMTLIDEDQNEDEDGDASVEGDPSLLCTPKHKDGLKAKKEKGSNRNRRKEGQGRARLWAEKQGPSSSPDEKSSLCCDADVASPFTPFVPKPPKGLSCTEDAESGFESTLPATANVNASTFVPAPAQDPERLFDVKNTQDEKEGFKENIEGDAKPVINFASTPNDKAFVFESKNSCTMKAVPQTITKTGKMRRKKSLSDAATKPLSKFNEDPVCEESQTNSFEFKVNGNFNIGTTDNNSNQGPVREESQTQTNSFDFKFKGNFNIGTSNNKERSTFIRDSSANKSPMDISPNPTVIPSTTSSGTAFQFSGSVPKFNLGVAVPKTGPKSLSSPRVRSGRPLSSSVNTNLRESIAEKNKGKDMSGRMLSVEHFKKEGSEYYSTGKYKESAIAYAHAIKAYKFNDQDSNVMDPLLGALRGNRAVALLMYGAFKLASVEFEKALESFDVSEMYSAPFHTEKGIHFAAKLHCRLAEAFMKCGLSVQASEQYNRVIERVEFGLDSLKTNFLQDLAKERSSLCQLKTTAELGLNNVRSFDAIQSSLTTNSLSRTEELGFIHDMLRIAPGCTDLIAKKISICSELKQWDDVILASEKLSCYFAKMECFYIWDFKTYNPFPKAPNSCKFFEGVEERQYLSAEKVAKAVFRMPDAVRYIYLRGLRLQLRNDQAASALTALESSSDYFDVEVSRERTRFRKTCRGKEDGDRNFHAGKYQQSASCYLACSKIDSGNTRPSTSGGSLHAILHCNRAACFMALNKYREALKECTAALRIHPNYMKAMARRSRSNVQLKRFDDAIEDMKNCIKIGTTGGKSFDTSMSSPEQIEKLREELDQIKTKRHVHKTAERLKEQRAKQRQEQQRWYDKNIGGDHFGKSSFFNKSSHKFSGSEGYRSSWQSKNRSSSNVSSTEDEHCYYRTLSVSTTAKAAEIKKAYHRLALRFHPDKNKDPSAAAMFRKINAAYEVLGDVDKRNEYNRERRLKSTYG